MGKYISNTSTQFTASIHLKNEYGRHYRSGNEIGVMKMDKEKVHYISRLVFFQNSKYKAPISCCHINPIAESYIINIKNKNKNLYVRIFVCVYTYNIHFLCSLYKYIL